MQKTQYTLEQNLIIKKPVPPIGIVCSNRRRAERIVKSHLSDSIHLEEYNTAWQLDIYLGNYQGTSLFVAVIPVGAAGAAFAIQQLVVAGAKAIIRYGSNDDPFLTRERMNEIVLVDQADNLYGLMQGSGAPQSMWGKTLHASTALINALQVEAEQLGLTPKLAICHHVEDYAAYSFPAAAGEFSQSLVSKIQELEAPLSDRMHCRDMESAAIFFRAYLDHFHAATVLQNVPKFAGKHQTYEGEQGEIAKHDEKKFADLIFNTLVSFSPEA